MANYFLRLWYFCAFVLINIYYCNGEDIFTSKEDQLSNFGIQSNETVINMNKVKKFNKIKYERTTKIHMLSGKYLDRLKPSTLSQHNCTEEVNGTKLSCKVEIGYVGQFIGNLQNAFEHLTLYLYYNHNDWEKLLPAINISVDLRNISHLSRLKYLAVLPLTENPAISYFFLRVDKNTFQNLSRIEILRFNIPINNQSFEHILKYLKNITELDLSYISYMGYANLLNSIKPVSHFCLRKLKLRQFQNIGFGALSLQLVLNITELLQGFSHLEELDVSMNNLAAILPGLISTLPNLKKFIVSNNCITGVFTGTLFSEIAFHKTLEYVDVSNQINIQSQNGPVSKYNANDQRLTLSDQRLTLNDQRLTFNDQRLMLNDQRLTLNDQRLMLNDQRLTLNDQMLIFNYKDSQFFYSHFIHCLNLYDGQNISNALHNKTIVCNVIKCLHILVLPDDILCSAFAVLEIDSRCQFLIRIPLFKNMEILKADNLDLILTYLAVSQGRICFQKTKLNKISFSGNKRWLERISLSQPLNNIYFISGVNNVTSVDFHNNGLKLLLPTDTMTKYPNLRYVDFAGNFITLQNLSLCNYWHNLEKFNISSTNITCIHESLFMDCSNLKILDLSNNKLTFSTIYINVNRLSNIKLLDISNNLLSYLPTKMIHQLSALHKVVPPIKMNLLGNPLVCNCSSASLEFIKWFNTTSVHFPGKNKYVCSGHSGLNLVEHIDRIAMEHSCNPSYLFQIITTVLSTFIFFVVLLSFGVVYRYRWRIRYFMFTLKNKGFLKKKASESEVNQWKYDAFISYCALDRFWVHDVLMKTLENEYGFKLCIHYRDFPVGDWIVDAIVTSIKDSKEMIIVISEISLTRPWCQFELEVAFTEARNRNMKIILIKLENISQPVDSPAVLWILENQVNLEWSNNSEGQKLFWTTLVSHLYGDSEGGCCCCCKYGKKAITSSQVGKSIAEVTQPLLP